MDILTDPAERLLAALKTGGPQTAQMLAAGFGQTAMAVRKQVGKLIADRLVVYTDERAGRGRPRRIFRLSEEGHRRFPDGHGALAAELIESVRGLFGGDGLDEVITLREERQRRRYETALADSADLGETVCRLAAERNREGYMARAEPDGPEGWLLIEDHCPICDAATACQGFCRSELSIFRTVLGSHVRVERTEHLLADGRRCTYRITAAENT
jgi:predicted ArsR family transcriptional regulator